MLSSILAISAGASLGAVLRWLLSLGLNAVWATMPLGTLAANLIGAYLVGFLMSLLEAHAGIVGRMEIVFDHRFFGWLDHLFQPSVLKLWLFCNQEPMFVHLQPLLFIFWAPWL